MAAREPGEGGSGADAQWRRHVSTELERAPPGPSGADAQWRRHVSTELERAPPEAAASSRRSSRSGSGGGPVAEWRQFSNVDLHEEERRHSEAALRVGGAFDQWWFATQAWLLAISVGVCSSLTGTLIEIMVNRMASFRFGFCVTHPTMSVHHCPEDGWHDWGHGAGGFCANVGLGVLMAAVSAWLVFAFAPAAAGSGIPEVKTILNGFVMTDVVSRRTLCVKVPGLALSVAAGMSLGKEGPLVHVAVCWAELLSRLCPQFQNEGKRRELFSAAAAAGVSTAFGAPVGGVLFSLEEVSSFFPTRTLLLAFTAAVSAAFMLSVINAGMSKGVTMFSVEHSQACSPLEFVGFALIGVLGGLVGAAFNSLNTRWSEVRLRPGFRKRVPAVAEVALIALVTLVTSWPSEFTRPLSADAIHAMFETCGPNVSQSTVASRLAMGLCEEDGAFAPLSWPLARALAAACVVRFCQMTLTFGTACPAGLFVPSLFVGACLGRLVGVMSYTLNQSLGLFSHAVQPGVYSMVGAAAVLGGVCRVTISLVVIMFELTGSSDYIVPFMLSVLIAKLVGDMLNDGIYDLYIVLKGYPFLKDELDVTFTQRCCDIMEADLTKLDLSCELCAGDLRSMLETHSFRGFPVVDGRHFVGFVKRRSLERLLAELAAGDIADDDPVERAELEAEVDRHVLRMVHDTPLSEVHKVFKQLGNKYVFLLARDSLVGMISKKSFIRFLKSGAVGHMADPSGGSPTGRPSGAAARHLLSRVRGHLLGGGDEADQAGEPQAEEHPAESLQSSI